MNQIRENRLKQKITQAELATKCGIDRSTVAKWETGKSLPRADTLMHLANLLQCTVDELLKENKNEKECGK